jgi:hypothetical protein
MQQETGESQDMQADQGCGQPLVVAAEPSGAAKPSEGACHHPTPRKQFDPARTLSCDMNCDWGFPACEPAVRPSEYGPPNRLASYQDISAV